MTVQTALGRSATINAGMFTSAADDWATPDDFYAALDAEFNFTLDPCAYPHTAKCGRYFTREDDGLRQTWSGRVFMNPPYGRVIGNWVAKAYHSAQTTAEVVVALIPARTCSRYWHDYCMKAAEIRFVKGRLRFGCQSTDRNDNAPFPNAVIVFRKGAHVPRVSSMGRGAGGDLFALAAAASGGDVKQAPGEAPQSGPKGNAQPLPPSKDSDNHG